MLTYVLYTKLMTSKTGYRFNIVLYTTCRSTFSCSCKSYLCRHVESLPCLTGHKFCIQHVGQHYLQEQENVDLHVAYKTYDQ
jgi:hypothetical protein